MLLTKHIPCMKVLQCFLKKCFGENPGPLLNCCPKRTYASQKDKNPTGKQGVQEAAHVSQQATQAHQDGAIPWIRDRAVFAASYLCQAAHSALSAKAERPWLLVLFAKAPALPHTAEGSVLASPWVNDSVTQTPGRFPRPRVAPVF